jgi:hypothetical protein
MTEDTIEKSVVVSSLNPLQLFKYKNRIYSRRRIHSGGVTAISEKGDKVITLSPNTLVKPV